ncbi:AI-2E family transporter [Accumulibacter sp.]|uniref:AI-2E family transporter n=1 Tax=Accumulibacter sp. TaxID=2053492 RepID=UPI0028C498D8|nr:AI-2E family transporter [Accumulibacter sp.]
MTHPTTPSTAMSKAPCTDSESLEPPDTVRANDREMRLVRRMLMVLLALALIYTLALGRTFFVPIMLAFLTSLVLYPLVRWLERHKVPRALGAGAVVALLLCSLGFGLSASIAPTRAWFEQAPRVLRQIERKLSPIKKKVEEVNKAADQVDRITSVSAAQAIEIKDVSYKDMLYDNAGGLVTGASMTTLLLYFFLSWGGVVVRRIGDLLDERGRRRQFVELTRILEGELSKYLATITAINFCLGVVVAGTLYAFGMPNPLVWGGVAAVLNFIPYLGSVMTASALGVTALLTLDGYLQPALVVAAFFGLTALEGQVITPLVLGRQLALNPLIVFLSVLFWFWLWGIPGALMAVPILITFKLAGDRIDAMRAIAAISQR